MNYLSFDLEKNDDYVQWVYQEEVFSPEECGRIVALGRALPQLEGRVSGNKELLTEVRASTVAALRLGEETRWIFERISTVVQECNAATYHFQISGLMDPIQFTQYDEGQFYRWHDDHGPGALSVRKLTAVVMLTDPGEYAGGEFEFFDLEPCEGVREQGSVMVFPAFIPHQVKPVTRGLRNSLVCWVIGPHFR